MTLHACSACANALPKPSLVRLQGLRSARLRLRYALQPPIPGFLKLDNFSLSDNIFIILIENATTKQVVKAR